MKLLATLAGVCLIAPMAALADSSVTKTYTLKRDGAIRVVNVAGSIEIETWNEAKVEIEADLHGKSELKVSGDDDHRVIEVDQAGSRRMGESDLRIMVPVEARVDAKGVSAEIRIRGPRGKRLVAESVSGDVDVECAAEAIDVGSVSGDVRVDAGGSARVSISSVSGDIEADNVSGEVRAETVSGDIEVRGRKVDRLDFETVSGDAELDIGLTRDARVDAELLSGEVELLISGNLDARIEAETFSGSIKSDFGEVKERRYGSSQSLDATVGSGRGSIQIESYSGDIVIRKR